MKALIVVSIAQFYREARTPEGEAETKDCTMQERNRCYTVINKVLIC